MKVARHLIPFALWFAALLIVLRADAGTIQGTIGTSTGGVIQNATINFALSQSAPLLGQTSVAPVVTPATPRTTAMQRRQEQHARLYSGQWHGLHAECGRDYSGKLSARAGDQWHQPLRTPDMRGSGSRGRAYHPEQRH